MQASSKLFCCFTISNICFIIYIILSSDKLFIPNNILYINIFPLKAHILTLFFSLFGTYDSFWILSSNSEKFISFENLSKNNCKVIPNPSRYSTPVEHIPPIKRFMV